MLKPKDGSDQSQSVGQPVVLRDSLYGHWRCWYARGHHRRSVGPIHTAQVSHGLSPQEGETTRLVGLTDDAQAIVPRGGEGWGGL